MIELPLVLVAGLLGSAHCIGMCGPFALMLGSDSRSWMVSIGRQMAYSAGRIFTYTMMGTAAGFGGLRLAEKVTPLINVSAVLSILAGAFLIYQGLQTAGVLSPTTHGHSGLCLAGGILKSFLQRRKLPDMFLAGVFTGFLPCGLVYGFLGMAASSQNMIVGGLTMATFGAGTVPIMVATGCGGRLLSLSVRTRLFRAAAWCVVLAGMLSILRGAGFLGLSAGDSAVESCPFCVASSP